VRRFTALAVLLVVGLVAGPAETLAAKAPRARAATLERFDSCGELTQFARRQFARTGGTTGVPFRAGVVAPAVLRPPGFMPSSDRSMATIAPAASSAPEAGTDFSETNVQEAGVDEADLVKTNGRHLFVASGGALRVLDVTDAQPRVVGRLALPGSAHQLLLRGSRLLVLAAAESALPVPVEGGVVASTALLPESQRVSLSEVDVSDPAAPKVARTMDLAGPARGRAPDRRHRAGGRRLDAGAHPVRRPGGVPAARRPPRGRAASCHGRRSAAASAAGPSAARSCRATASVTRACSAGWTCSAC
jgi:hypothetical protein